MSQFRQLSKNLFVALSWVAGLTAFPLLAAPPNQAARYRLIFADEFDTLDLGTSIDRSSAQPHKWYEGVWFSHGHAPRERFSIADSALSLVWKRGQPQPDSSISTFTRDNPHYHAWRYGYFEARMKWQPGAGAWPAFWLIPVHAAMNGEAPQEAGEIDIFEGQGTEPHTFFGTLHRWKGSLELDSTSRHNRFPLPPQADFARYHTYGLLWAPGRVTWYFDDIALHSEPTYPIFDRQDYCLILSMQAGSDWKSGDLRAVAGQSLQLTVDWVRVWQK
jgi:hypothetical protein